MVELSCEEVWREVSSYLDSEVDSAMRAAIEDHLRKCAHCSAVVDGTRNVMQIYGDGRLFEVPAGFGDRLRQRLEMEGKRTPHGNWTAWVLTAAAAGIITIGLGVSSGTAGNQPRLRSAHSQPSQRIPAGLVYVSQVGTAKLFHVKGCHYMHGKEKALPAEEAIRQGYTPCIYCMREFLGQRAAVPGPDPERYSKSESPEP